MVILHARGVIQPEKRERRFELLDAVTPPSRAEDACQSGLYAHFHAPHFTEFFAGLGEVLAEPPAGEISEVPSTITLDEALAAAGIGG